jgi:hypothetical protein
MEGLPEIESLETLAQYQVSEEFKAVLKRVFEEQDADQKATMINSLKNWELSLKNKFNPENTNEHLKALKIQANQALNDRNNEKQEQYRQLLVQISQFRESNAALFKIYDQTIGNLANKIGAVSNQGGSGRSNRAKRAGLLSSHAGKSVIQGAQTDTHGNAKGTDYDLGVDGAFCGMKIIVLQLFWFDNSHTKSAFDKKGFSHTWFTTLPSVKELELLLDDPEVCQLWLISDSATNTISADHVKVIEKFYKSGKSLYIWGDNVPYYHSSNTVLSGLFHPDLQMTGCEWGCNVVQLCQNAFSADEKHFGFIPDHLLTTGLAHLYEGHTVASFNEKNIALHGFSPLMWGSAGNLISIYREADKQGGAVIADGAFTRLYISVDDAGTIRYIINAACWLAVESLGNATSFEDIESEIGFGQSSGSVENYYDVTNAFSGSCSILYEPAPVVCLSVLQIANPEEVDRNTSDLVLNDPLGFGEMNYQLLGRHLYGETTGKVVLEMGRDPYLRVPVSGLLPVVNFSSAINLKLFSEELCRVFMGNSRLFTAAQLLFVGVLDSVLDPKRAEDYEPETLAAVRFLLDQSLNHFQTTPDFTDSGDKISLLNAFQQYFTVSPALVQVSKSFSTVCLIARLLFERQILPVESLQLIVRRGFLKFVLGSCLKFVKDNSANSNGNLVFRSKVEEKLYSCWEGIAVKNSGRLAEKFSEVIPEFYCAPLERFESLTGKKLDQSVLLSFVIHELTNRDLRSYRIEALIEVLLKVPEFRQIWDGEDLSPNRVVEILNARFINVFEAAPPHRSSALVPFATTFGPTVFSCTKCGVIFGDPNVEPTLEYVESVKKTRNAHFVEHYASDLNGYPTDASYHFSIHRAVQLVLRNKFPEATEISDDMIAAVGSHVSSLKGNIYRSNIQEMVVFMINSYLECKRKGQPNISDCVHFYDRYIFERDQILANKN